MSIITVEYYNTVLFDGSRVSDRIIAASIDSAVLIDTQFMRDDPADFAEDLYDALAPHDVTPTLISLSPMKHITREVMEKIAVRGYNVLYFARTGDAADVDADSNATDTFINAGPGADTGIRSWTAPAIPLALPAGASTMMISLAYINDGHRIGGLPALHGRAFVEDLTAGIDGDAQMRLCAEIAKSFHGCDAVTAILRRGLGRLAERERILRELTAAGVELPANLRAKYAADIPKSASPVVCAEAAAPTSSPSIPMLVGGSCMQ